MLGDTAPYKLKGLVPLSVGGVPGQDKLFRLVWR